MTTIVLAHLDNRIQVVTRKDTEFLCKYNCVYYLELCSYKTFSNICHDLNIINIDKTIKNDKLPCLFFKK